MSEGKKTYRIIYDVHCRFENFFGKEMIVKNCYSEAHAKYKLGEYYEKKYKAEFEFISFKSTKEEESKFDGELFDTLFGDALNKDTYKSNPFMDLLNKHRKK